MMDDGYCEQALREAVLAGNQSAWRALYERHFSMLYGYAFHRAGRDEHRADEIVQETWLVAVRRIADFDPCRGAFEGWLKGIADHVLQNQRRRWLRDRSADGQVISERAGPDPDATAETRELLALALTALPASYQAVLHAKYQEQLTVREIADRLGHTSKAVESLLSRARAAFRQQWNKLNGA